MNRLSLIRSRSVVLREAFNRMVVQMAVLYRLLRG